MSTQRISDNMYSTHQNRFKTSDSRLESYDNYTPPNNTTQYIKNTTQFTTCQKNAMPCHNLNHNQVHTTNPPEMMNNFHIYPVKQSAYQSPEHLFKPPKYSTSAKISSSIIKNKSRVKSSRKGQIKKGITQEKKNELLNQAMML